jgi:hypothetical protein
MMLSPSERTKGKGRESPCVLTAWRRGSSTSSPFLFGASATKSSALEALDPAARNLLQAGEQEVPAGNAKANNRKFGDMTKVFQALTNNFVAIEILSAIFHFRYDHLI